MSETTCHSNGICPGERGIHDRVHQHSDLDLLCAACRHRNVVAQGLGVGGVRAVDQN